MQGKPTESIKKKRKKDATALAHLIYDLFKEEQINSKIRSGQKNAKQSTNN